MHADITKDSPARKEAAAVNSAASGKFIFILWQSKNTSKNLC